MFHKEFWFVLTTYTQKVTCKLKKSPPHGQAHFLLRASAAKELDLPHRHPNRIFTFYTQFFEIFKMN